ncbi:MAG TPA: RluA family pseudouridine synthase [Planctomycetota bacterium]|nr:RluA family pseudouridine synthase [Planctomycetota bacterium]
MDPDQLEDKIEDQIEEQTLEPVTEAEFRVKRQVPGRRIDRYLSMRFAAYSRTLIQKLIRQGIITVNGQPVKPSYETRKGDVIHVEFPVLETGGGEPEDIPIDVIYEDDHMLAINKQPDIVTHPAPGHRGGTLLNAILHHCGPIEDREYPDRPGIVHRLDKDTTGIMLFAKTEAARSNIQQQFELRKVQKTYTAIVENDFDFDSDIIDLPIGSDRHHRERMAIDLIDGRPAQTVYTVLERFGDYTLVRCQPRTGRTHQIRVHLSAIGHPIASDDAYDAKAPIYPSTLDPAIPHTEDEEPIIERQALHATTIAFRHPSTKQWLELEAPFHADFLRMLDFLRKRGPVAPRKPSRKGRQRH